MESDVGCGRERGQGRVNTPLMIRQGWTETSCTLNDAHTHTHTHASPLGILNLLSFLYHRQPVSLSAIRTGSSVSGQSEGFRVKSVAEQIHIKQ